MENIRIKAVYEDGRPATGEVIHIGYGGMEQEMITDEYGTIELDDIPAGISVYVYQLEADIKRSMQGFYTDGRQDYPVTLIFKEGLKPAPGPAGPMTLQFVDQAGKPVSNLQVELVYDGKKQAIRPDPEGKILLNGLPFGRVIEVSANADSYSYMGSFSHQEGIDCHLIALKKTGWRLW
jgi:hypothetical protein